MTPPSGLAPWLRATPIPLLARTPSGGPASRGGVLRGIVSVVDTLAPSRSSVHGTNSSSRGLFATSESLPKTGRVLGGAARGLVPTAVGGVVRSGELELRGTPVLPSAS